MNTIIERITEAIKEILIGMIQNGLEGMFVEVNDKVGTIASQVGQTPQGWNTGVFNLIQNLSQTVIVMDVYCTGCPQWIICPPPT